MKKTLNASILTLLFMCYGCATILSGNKDFIRFDSTPSGAVAYINGIENCRTPCSAFVKRQINETLMDVKLEGYMTQQITIHKRLDELSYINLFIIPAWVIDWATGAMMRFEPKAYHVTLVPKAKPNLK